MGSSTGSVLGHAPGGYNPGLALEYLDRLQLLDSESLQTLYARPTTHYWSDDWSTGFYRLQARAGLISTAFVHEELGPVLMPEIQSSYAVLDWGDLHLSRSMRRWMRSTRRAEGEYALRVGSGLDEIIDGVVRTYGEHSWLIGAYADLLRSLLAEGARGDFELMTSALVSGRTGRIVAGELGYRVGRVYTSLTGFFDRRDPANDRTGTLQLALLAGHLERAGFAFWNLGHPSLQYKLDLGARVLERSLFLRRWFDEGCIAPTP
jgi:Leu/Phe-tRNA-protein transferase